MSNSGIKDKGWAAMQELLDQELPQEKDDTSIGGWYWLILLLISLGSFIYWYSQSNPRVSEQPHAVPSASQSVAFTEVERISGEGLLLKKESLEKQSLDQRGKLISPWTLSSFDYQFVKMALPTLKDQSLSFQPTQLLASTNLQQVFYSQTAINLDPTLPSFSEVTPIESFEKQKICNVRLGLQVGTHFTPSLNADLLGGLTYSISPNYYLTSTFGVSYFFLDQRYFNQNNDKSTELFSADETTANFESSYVGAQQNFSLHQLGLFLQQGIGKVWNQKWSTECFLSYEYLTSNRPSGNIVVRTPQFELPNRIILQESTVDQEVVKDNLTQHYLGIGAKMNRKLTEDWSVYSSIHYQHNLNPDFLNLARSRRFRLNLGVEYSF